MATSTIKNLAIKINGTPVVGSKSTLGDVGVLSADSRKQITLSSKSVTSTSTPTYWDGISFTPGVWMCNLMMYCENPGSAGNTNIAMYTSNTSASSWVWYTRQCSGNPTTGWIGLNIFFTLVLTSTTTYYPGIYQQSGATRTCSGYFHAIKW